MIRRQSAFALFFIVATISGTAEVLLAETIKLKLQSIEPDETARARPLRVVKDEEWDVSRTAVIVCDVWDYHHCLNAVRRLEEFAPRLDQVLNAARTRGAIVIHAPSDCMSAYADHPARQRALQVPKANPMPPDIEYWCSRLKNESQAYPIDQSDGGEDDDPQEHADWAAKLKAMGRNPGTPWKMQSDLITIDAKRDYISDRGDEVWSILEKHGARNVILTGVHCNMCVLGRPFGLRQMVRNGKHVVLLRDMTDSMYSPKSWPYVDHFAGHDLVIEYVETDICPTITSDQFLGGEPFRWQADQRDRPAVEKLFQQQTELELAKHWTPEIQIATFQARHAAEFQDALKKNQGSVWYRGALRIPQKWPVNGRGDGPVDGPLDGPVSFSLPVRGKFQVWLNGHELLPSAANPSAAGQVRFGLPPEHVVINDYNLLVVKTALRSEYPANPPHMHLIAGPRSWSFEQHGWQVRIGEDARFSNIPLPAKFGIGPDAVLRLDAFPDAF